MMKTSTRLAIPTRANTSVAGGKARKPMAAKKNVLPHSTDKHKRRSQSVSRIRGIFARPRANDLRACLLSRRPDSCGANAEPAALGGWQNPRECRHEFAVVVDDHIGGEVANGARCIAKADGDAGYIGS